LIALCDQIALCKLTVTTPPKFDWRCAIDNPSKDDYQKRRFSFWNFDELLSIMLGRIEEIANQPDVRLWDNHPNLARAANDRLPPFADTYAKLRHTFTPHQLGQLTLCGVRVAANTTFCSASLSRRDPSRCSPASTIQSSSRMRALSR
jgi:hypothetical protein